MSSKNFIIEEDDTIFEEIIVKEPYELKKWINYIESKKRRYRKIKEVFILYERAVKYLPYSYKLWYQYLNLRKSTISKKNICSIYYEQMNKLYERSLTTLNKYPVIWLEYLKFLMKQKYISRIRKVLNRSLTALPITQHKMIWEVIITWIKNEKELPLETVQTLYKRYLKLFPQKVMDYVDLLKERNNFTEACKELEKLLISNDTTTAIFAQIKESKADVRKEICEIVQDKQDQLDDLDVEKILRSELERINVGSAKIWVTLANHFIYNSLFEKARDIFEEALGKIVTIKDFSIIFDSYSAFEEEIVKMEMEKSKKQKETMKDEDEEEEDDDEIEVNDDYEGKLSSNFKEIEEEENSMLNLKIERWERLLNRRPILLSDIKLRQSPNSVSEWIKRIILFTEPVEKIKQFENALKTIEPFSAEGKLSRIYILFANYYEDEFEASEQSEKIFQVALTKEFRYIDDLSAIFCAYSEFKLRNKKINEAKQVLEIALFSNWKRKMKGNTSVIAFRKLSMKDRLFKNLKIWRMYLDLCESSPVDPITKCFDVYDTMIKLKIITPRLILSYASILETNGYYDKSFQVYEKGISLFSYPSTYYIWVPYLTKFIQYYKGKNLERTRDLFNTAVQNIPKKFAFKIFLLYSQFEETYGLIRHALQVLDRSIPKILDSEKLKMFKIYTQMTSEYYSISRVRSVFEKALNILPEEDLYDIYTMFIQLEIKLGEIDRARALFANCSNYTKEKKFFDEWEDFEKIYGNVESYKEMYKIKFKVLGEE